jgi:secreted PhoX family phosphatase
MAIKTNLDPRVKQGLLEGFTRRSFLKGSSVAIGTSLLASPFVSLASKASSKHTFTFGPDYGPLLPAKDLSTGLHLLDLPEGFSYLSFGWTGDPLMDGSLTPDRHDGMAVVQTNSSRVILVRNHEVRGSEGVFSPNAPVYDRAAQGGTTNIEFDIERGYYIKSWASLTGTITNCAGGPTPWGTWLTCEEDVRGPQGDSTYDAENTPDLKKTHGWVFEVPATEPATAKPIKGMGRFVHEAAAVDPRTDIIYLTEDISRTLSEDNLIGRAAGFYRYISKVPQQPAKGGKLQMLAVVGTDNKDLSGEELGNVYDVRWVDIDEPEDHGEGNGVFLQGFAKGGAAFQRLEGAWYGNDLIYFISTSGGVAMEGQVWVYDPENEKLYVVFESESAGVVDNPDNITVSPRGGIILCEDGGAGQFLHGMTREGDVFRFCRNSVLLNGEINGIMGDFTGSEFAGATFDPYGRWLFVNVQTPGITFAITGPWSDGVL